MTAQTIAQQLGGRRFTMMTGAHTLIDHGDGLSFKLPRQVGFVRDGINYVLVTLTPADLYTVEYGKLRGFDYAVIDTAEGVYADDLARSVSRRTGLDVSL